jgi:hypothetical protein
MNIYAKNKISLLLLILAFILLPFAGCGKPSAPVVEAQSASIVELKFTTKFYDALDKKVAFKTGKESLYLAGVISLSNKEIAFMFQPEARFTITNNGLERLKENSDNLEFKLDEKNVDVVAILSEEEIEQLRLLKEPENGLNPIALNFVHEGSPMSTYGKNFAKCCCGKDDFVDKVCEKILWDALDGGYPGLEDFQETMAIKHGYRIICAVIISRLACNGCGPTCPDGKWGCPDDKCSKTLDDLDEL